MKQNFSKILCRLKTKDISLRAIRTVSGQEKLDVYLIRTDADGNTNSGNTYVTAALFNTRQLALTATVPNTITGIAAHSFAANTIVLNVCTGGCSKKGEEIVTPASQIKNNHTPQLSIRIYHSPAETKFTVEASGQSEAYTIRINNLPGQEIYRKTF